MDAVDPGSRPRACPPGKGLTLSTQNVNGMMSSEEKRHNVASSSAAHVCVYQEVLKFDRELETGEFEQLSADVAPGSRCGWTRHCGAALSPTMGHLDMKQYAALGDRVVLTQLGHGDNTADGMDVVTIYAPADPTLRTRFYLDLTETLMQRPDANKSLIVITRLTRGHGRRGYGISPRTWHVARCHVG